MNQTPPAPPVAAPSGLSRGIEFAPAEPPIAENAPVAPLEPSGGLLRLSPINTRRLANFKSNRRGFWSLWIFLVIFVVTLFAEFIANDRPIFVSYKGEWLYPIFVDYPEEKFGGFLPVTDYRDPVVANEIAAHGFMIWPPIHFSYDTHNLDLPSPAPSPPTWMLSDTQCHPLAQRLDRNKGRDPATLGCNDIEWNWLGTDDQGRDVVARLIYGFRISVLFGLTLAIASSIIGVAAGALQGYFGGWTDLLFQRFIDIWTSVPQLYLLIIISSFIQPSFFVLLGILLLFSWVALVGVVRAEFLRARNFEYVRAARALGLSDLKIMWKHVLPNAMVATLTFLPFILNGSITTLTSLDFLGFGLPPGSPSLGELLNQGKSNLQAPWLGLSGFIVIASMLSLLIFIGEAVRDAFDPRKGV
jgi:microcin C transport system permease protein